MKTETCEVCSRVFWTFEQSDMKAFVLSTIYDENGEISCGEARASKWHKMLKKKSTARLPPDDDTLSYHLERTNYLAYCQRHFDLIEHPSPTDRGWEVINAKCRPVRHGQPALSPILKHSDCPADESSEGSCSDEEYGDSSTGSDSDEWISGMRVLDIFSGGIILPKSHNKRWTVLGK